MTNSEKIKMVNQLLIEVIKDEADQNETSLSGLKDVVLSILVEHWHSVREPEIFMESCGIECEELEYN